MPDCGSDGLAFLERQDAEIVHRRDGRCVIVSLPGRYSFAVGKNASERRLFSCRAIYISTHAIALLAPVTAKLGVPVSADIEQLGKLKGSIIRVFNQGFAMSVALNDERRWMLAARIDWIERSKECEVIDRRAPRFIPRRPHSLLMLADGSIIPCFVIDISVSVAGVSSDIKPKVGTVLAVGKVVGRVVRHFPEGFAVHFADVQDRQRVEALVIRSYRCQACPNLGAIRVMDLRRLNLLLWLT